MSTLEVIGLMIIVAVVLVWRITWLAPGRCWTPHWWDALNGPPSSS